MKLYFLLFSFINIASAGSLRRIFQGGYVRHFGFEANGQSHVITEDLGRYKWYLLDPSNRLITFIGWASSADAITYMKVSSQGNVYLNFVSPDVGYTLLYINYDPSFIDYETIDGGPFKTFFSDNNDYVFYSKSTGLNMLKPSSKIPRSIKNIEGMIMVVDAGKAPKTDSSGNVYFLMNPDKFSSEILVKITKDALEEDVPSAELIYVNGDLEKMTLNYLFVDDRDNVWVIGANSKNDAIVIKKLVADDWETMTIPNPNLCFQYSLLSKDRIFFFTCTWVNNKPLGKVFATTLDKEIIEFPQLNNLTFGIGMDLQFISDTEGSAYFASPQDFSPSLGKLFVIQAEEAEPTPIKVGNMTMGSLRMDCDNNLWIVPGEFLHYGLEIYRLKKGSTIVEKVLGPPPEGCYAFTDVFFNCITKKITVSCMNGYYVFNED